MAHVRRKSDGKAFNVVSGKLMTKEEAKNKNITACFILLESLEEPKETVHAMYAPFGENTYEILEGSEGLEVKMPKSQYAEILETEVAPLVKSAEDAAYNEQQERIASGDNILDISEGFINKNFEAMQEAVSIYQDEKNDLL